MPYDQNNTYNKFQSDCESCSGSESGGCGCSKEPACGCCPVGTVAVYSPDGKMLGCLTPNDAELFSNGVIESPEGYVKVYDPNTGKYLGMMLPADAIQLIEFLTNGTLPSGGVATFNVVFPQVGPSGYYELTYDVLDAISNELTLVVDRLGDNSTIAVGIINSVEDIQFSPSGTTTMIPSQDSDVAVQFIWTTTTPGVYTFDLTFITSNQTHTVPVRLTLS